MKCLRGFIFYKLPEISVNPNSPKLDDLRIGLHVPESSSSSRVWAEINTLWFNLTEVYWRVFFAYKNKEGDTELCNKMVKTCQAASWLEDRCLLSLSLVPHHPDHRHGHAVSLAYGNQDLGRVGWHSSALALTQHQALSGGLARGGELLPDS